MARRYSQLETAHRDFIERQHIFFTASAALESHVNLSPRSTSALRVLGERSVAYLDQTGSGNETAAHVRAGGHVTLMFCSFEGAPSILRLYGRGRILRRGSAEYAQLLADLFGGSEPPGARQIVALDIDSVQTSCGFGVPLFDYRAERPTLDRWAQTKGEDGLESYRHEHNRKSIDGLPTGLYEEHDRLMQFELR